MGRKISVIMSVYNDEKYLAGAITSILNQTYQDFEFIICNDCSTDSSESIILSYLEEDERIVYFKNEKNAGLAASLNHCLEKATGEYIARMDSDDFSLPDRFEKQVKFLDDNPWCAVIGGQMAYMNGEGTVYTESAFQTEISAADVVKRVSVAHPTIMVRKAVIDEVHGYSVGPLTRRAEDYDLWCKIVEKGYHLHNLPDIVLKYRQDAVTIKKRKYTYRVDEFKIKNYWRKRLGYPLWYIVYAIKPLIVGLFSSNLYMKIKKMK